MFHKKERKAIKESNLVKFTEDTPTTDMFGTVDMIPKDTIGIVSDKNVWLTYYNTKFWDNVEITYIDRNNVKQRVLMSKYWQKLEPLEDDREEFLEKLGRSR